MATEYRASEKIARPLLSRGTGAVAVVGRVNNDGRLRLQGEDLSEVSHPLFKLRSHNNLQAGDVGKLSRSPATDICETSSLKHSEPMFGVIRLLNQIFAAPSPFNRPPVQDRALIG